MSDWPIVNIYEDTDDEADEEVLDNGSDFYKRLADTECKNLIQILRHPLNKEALQYMKKNKVPPVSMIRCNLEAFKYTRKLMISYHQKYLLCLMYENKQDL